MEYGVFTRYNNTLYPNRYTCGTSLHNGAVSNSTVRYRTVPYRMVHYSKVRYGMLIEGKDCCPYMHTVRYRPYMRNT